MLALAAVCARWSSPEGHQSCSWRCETTLTPHSSGSRRSGSSMESNQLRDCPGCTAAASHSALARLNYCCLRTGGGADAGAGFLLWELSTPFVHLRWLLHKSGRDKQRIYVVNGLLMAVVFFLCRPVWGTWLSYKVCGHINAVCRHVLV